MHSLADKVTSPAKNSLNDSGTVTSTITVTPSRQEQLTGKEFIFFMFCFICLRTIATPSSHANNLTPSVAAVFAAAAAAGSPNQVLISIYCLSCTY